MPADAGPRRPATRRNIARGVDTVADESLRGRRVATSNMMAGDERWKRAGHPEPLFGWTRSAR